MPALLEQPPVAARPRNQLGQIDHAEEQAREEQARLAIDQRMIDLQDQRNEEIARLIHAHDDGLDHSDDSRERERERRMREDGEAHLRECERR